MFFGLGMDKFFLSCIIDFVAQTWAGSSPKSGDCSLTCNLLHGGCSGPNPIVFMGR